MLTLTIRTDKPEAELGLYQDAKKLDYYSWPAHRELSDTIHNQMRTLLNKNKYNFEDIQGLIIYKGPGSFTGLRIGFSVANTFAYSLDCPIVTTNDSDWIEQGLELLKNSKSTKPVFPFYGSEVHITKPRK